MGCHALFQWNLPDPGIKPTSPVSPDLQAVSVPRSHWGSPVMHPQIQEAYLADHLIEEKLGSLSLPPHLLVGNGKALGRMAPIPETGL